MSAFRPWHLCVPPLLAVAAVVGTWSEQPLFASGRWFLATIYVAIGLGSCTTSLILFFQDGQRGNAWLTACLTVGWYLWQSTHQGIGPLTAIGFMISQVQPVAVGALLLRYPTSKFQTAERRFARTNLAAALVLGAALLFTGAPEPPDAARWWPNPWRNGSVNSAFGLAHGIWLFVTAGWFIVLFVGRWRRIGELERRTLTPIMVTAVATAVAYAAEWTRLLESTTYSDALSAVRASCVLAMAIAFTASAVQLRLARSGVTDLITVLARTGTAEGVQNALRSALADPHLRILYWVQEQECYVDGDGHRSDEPTGELERVAFPATTSAGAPLAVVLTDPTLQRHRKLVEAAVAISGLALENASLQAGLRAQLNVVKDTRARLLEAGLEERRRLERDLHDGAQQRLLGIGMRLGAIRAHGDSVTVAESVAVARAELQLALQELRDLAHGIYPALLTQIGLGPAVEAVAARLPIPVVIDIPDYRWPSKVESTAYFVACEALTNASKHAPASSVTISVFESDGQLTVVIIDTGPGDDTLNDPASLPRLRDRLAAVNGQLSVASSVVTGTELKARIPCALQ